MMMRIVLRILGAGCLLLCLWLSASTLAFFRDAVRAEGTVERVEARNDRCSKNKSGHRNTGKRRYACTRFDATLRFAHAGAAHVVKLDAGKAKGQDQPITGASLQAGQAAAVLFRPDAPQDAILADGATLQRWGKPLLALLFGVCMLLVSFARKR